MLNIYIHIYQSQWKFNEIVIHNSIMRRKQILKLGENNKKWLKENIRMADMGFHKYWKSSYVMISKFESLTMRLDGRKSSFYNLLHNTTLSFHS